jgi:biotin carboxylase
MKKNSLKGKKLLLLGTSMATCSMVRYAQKQGVEVLVADYYPPEKSEAKKIADKHVLISTTDIDKICNYARQENIDGVFCGVSEVNLKSVKAVCDELNLPCYYTQEQWDVCQNKHKFKELCSSYNIPVPHTYELKEEADIKKTRLVFPVIIKPADGSSAIVISICRNEADLLKAFPLAKKASPTACVIVEEYVVGDEYTAVYTIKDGEISLSCFRDRYPSLDHAGVTAQFDACLAPSIYYRQYKEKINDNVIRMLKGIGAYAGCVFFQGIATSEKIIVFECGYRMNGLMDYYNIEAATGVNYMEMMVNYALTGAMGGADLSRETPNPKEFWCIFNMTAHEGTISKREGLEKCLSLPYVIHCEYLLPIGRKVVDNNSLTQSVFRAYINAPTLEDIKSTIKKMQKHIRVLDENGNDMLFKAFDVERLRDAHNIRK